VIGGASSQVSLGPDLATSTKDAPAMVLAGEEIVYEIHVVNTGTELAYITLSDPTPANTTLAWYDYDPPNQYFSYSWGRRDDMVGQRRAG
jgi:uncharacterized repeat protein (TIGR01451 family)